MHALDDRWFLARILPYRTAGDTIDGVVLTLIDISERKRHEVEAAKLTGQIEQQAR